MTVSRADSCESEGSKSDAFNSLCYSVVYSNNNFITTQDLIIEKTLDLYAVGKEWEVMAKNLGLSPGRIEALKTRNKQHPDSVKEDMLQTWMKRQPRAADRVRLSTQNI